MTDTTPSTTGPRDVLFPSHGRVELSSAGVGFTIHIEADYFLTLAEIWPDGDEPDNPTAEHVKAAMESCGSKRTVLRDWELLTDLEVTVGSQRVWA